MSCDNKRCGPFFQAGQVIVLANERWMNRARKSLRMTDGGPVSGNTANTDGRKMTAEISAPKVITKVLVW